MLDTKGKERQAGACGPKPTPGTTSPSPAPACSSAKRTSQEPTGSRIGGRKKVLWPALPAYPPPPPGHTTGPGLAVARLWDFPETWGISDPVPFNGVILLTHCQQWGYAHALCKRVVGCSARHKPDHTHKVGATRLTFLHIFTLRTRVPVGTVPTVLALEIIRWQIQRTPR